MDHAFDLPDSTDWLNTPLSLLAPFESALRCQVCKDFFDNPVITSCSHTFCSICIRRCLSTEGKCPACRSSDQELKLRRNWAVQELVDTFRNARPSVLELAKSSTTTVTDDGDKSEQPASKKRKVEHAEQGGESAQEAASEGVRTRSRSRRTETPSQTATAEVIEDSQDEEFVPDDGLVACPICSRRMKETAVFAHLDTCTGSSDNATQSSRPSRQIAFGSMQTIPQAPRSPAKGFMTKPPERLPVINYSILKEGTLRRKLRDLGIPEWGPKPLLQRRHTEWMNLWNSNCDAITPKPKKELLRELEMWERTQGGNAPSASSLGATNPVMRKDFDAVAWSTNHDDEFKRLIANARKKSDALIRTTLPPASASNDGAERTPVPEQPAETSVVTANAPKPAELPIPINLTGVDGAAEQALSKPTNNDHPSHNASLG